MSHVQLANPTAQRAVPSVETKLLLLSFQQSVSITGGNAHAGQLPAHSSGTNLYAYRYHASTPIDHEGTAFFSEFQFRRQLP